jgi:hypothetical protein
MEEASERITKIKEQEFHLAKAKDMIAKRVKRQLCGMKRRCQNS